MSGTNTSPFTGLWRVVVIAPLAALLALAGCSDNDNDKKSSDTSTDYINAPSTGAVATIRRTTNGVPHILADDLESVTFGAGYAQAQDYVCLIADAIVKARSERSMYWGPGQDNINLINDFTYKAYGIREGATAELAAMSAEGHAMLRGFVAGYNKYVTETDPATFPTECRNGPWVTEIDEVDLLSYHRIVAGFASGEIFATGAVFAAVPPGVNPIPVPVAPAVVSSKALRTIGETPKFAAANAGARKDFTDIGLASNAWGIGADLTENGRGVLLANPHFPYTGTRRFYEMQLTVPNYYNAHGAGLIGTPIPLIAFNENLGWSHTVSTSRRFTTYELTLDTADPARLTYIKDGVAKPITYRDIIVMVNVGAAQPVPFQRRFYYSEYGPMLAMNLVTNGGLPAWGGGPSAVTGCASCAYSFRDANADTNGFLATWLQMGRAQNLAQFQQVFRNCGTTLWVNSTYADREGNAFYMDTSSAPNLSPDALRVLMAKYYGSAAFKALFDNGLTLLDGSNSRDDWVQGQCDSLVPYEGRPKLLRSDFVQNSNDSYWSTNVDAPLEGYSSMFGLERTPIGPRTRIGTYMLQNPTVAGYGETSPAGQDGLFGADDIATVLHNNRAWYAEQFLPELRSRCAAIGDGSVNVPDGSPRSVASACAVLATWNGRYDLDSVGAHVYRVFIADYATKFATELTVPFNPNDPVGTPSTPRPMNPDNLANDPMLVSLAVGLNRLDSASVPYDATLGAVQVFQPTGGVPPYPGLTAVPLGPSFPWHGGNGSVDGAFNAISAVRTPSLGGPVQEDTRLPRISCATVANTGDLCSTPGLGWQIAYGTSWHFGLEFTPDGPRALGLVSYSQSANPASPFFNDQQQRYSEKNMRAIPFSETEIADALLPDGETIVTDD
jgi:acyl-homoserine-lactone acylase